MSWYWNEKEGDYEGSTSCPQCGNDYDEIDYEFQICHICHFKNDNVASYPPGEKEKEGGRSC